MRAEEYRPQTIDTVQDWHVLVNPRSTSAARAQRMLFKLQMSEFRPKLDIITPLDADESPKKTQERLLGRLSLGSGVIVLGGDGTFNHVVNGIMSDPYLRELGTPLLAAGSGNGNDIATTHIGKPKHADLRRILREGSIRPIHPIVSTTETDHGVQHRYAVAYMGLGGTAYGAALFDAPKHRRSWLTKTPPTRLLSEAGLITKTVLRSPTFDIEGPDGKIDTLSELSIANYPREAIHGRWPTSPTDPDLLISWIEGKGIRRSVEWLGRLAAGSVAPLSEHIAPPATARIHPNEELRFIVGHRQALAHWDAETGIIPPYAEVSIRSNAEPFYAVSTQI